MHVSYQKDMYTFKSYICNGTRPEASTVEGYLADEWMTLCSTSLHSMKTKFNYPYRNYENQVESDGSYLSLTILAMD